MTPSNDNTHDLVSLNEAFRLTSMYHTIINDHRAEGRLPVALELGERRIAFVRSKVTDWVKTEISATATA